MLNKYPYNNGHLLIAPQRHEKHLAGLSAEEYGDLSEALRGSVGIVHEVLRPGGINLGMNLGKCAGAGVLGHFHLHVVPRWSGDTNFMSVTGDTRVIPEDLETSYKKLKSYFKN
jgi:ATP adenylyltransferase